MFKKLSKSSRGFTLIELLVVISIIAILVVAGAVVYTKILQNSRNAKRQSDLETVKNALVLYRTDNGFYPTSVNLSTDMSPIQNYVSVSKMIGPKGDSYTYTGGTGGGNCNSGKCTTFSVCATLENTTPNTYCVNNP